MIFDPDGEHAICDDGRMAVPVFRNVLDEAGFPTGERVRIGWVAPNHVGWPLAQHRYRDED
jgi:hypothetical protein